MRTSGLGFLPPQPLRCFCFSFHLAENWNMRSNESMIMGNVVRTRSEVTGRVKGSDVLATWRWTARNCWRASTLTSEHTMLCGSAEPLLFSTTTSMVSLLSCLEPARRFRNEGFFKSPAVMDRVAHGVPPNRCSENFFFLPGSGRVSCLRERHACPHDSSFTSPLASACWPLVVECRLRVRRESSTYSSSSSCTSARTTNGFVSGFAENTHPSWPLCFVETGTT
mmetsp:Transcript_63112/g.131199  ORF Transcript_63112/g.131199 Transcript_63112/m.131199 type:complete len:224 (+) Transcript_63112:313-984(+)